jgi:hypothetical protein
MLRASPSYWRGTFAAQKSAVAVSGAVRPGRAAARAEQLHLVERVHPLLALQRRRRLRAELVCALEDERPHGRHPRRLRCGEGRRRRAVDTRAERQRREGRRRRDRRHQAVVGPLAQELVRRQIAERDPVLLGCPVGDVGEREIVQRSQVRRLRREVVEQDVVGGLRDSRVGRLAVSLARVDGAVHRGGHVREVDERLTLEGAASDRRVLGDLVPLECSVPRRQCRGMRRLRTEHCDRRDDDQCPELHSFLPRFDRFGPSRFVAVVAIRRLP